MKAKAIAVLFSFSILFLLFAGCIETQDYPTIEIAAVQECKQLCTSALQASTDLSKGPCIGNPMQSNTDFVCDIAHKPRAAIDDETANQCSAFPAQAKHFVELDTECNLIKLN